MKLEKEDISFIDNYLKKEGITYSDIRYEMVDHIASAVEEKMEVQQASFYYAFKAYMAANKSEIIKNNRKYILLAGYKALSVLFKNFINPVFIFLISLFFLLFYSLAAVFPDFDYQSTFQISHFIVTILLGGTFLYKQFSGKERFSVADKMLGFYCFLNYLPNSLFRVQDKIASLNLLFIYYSVTLSFSIVVYLSYREITKSYKNQYQLQ
ncbi:hypothetical protein FLJC2902T_04640 [Flavobacterium limnosediminis JC2902]|uniref:Uncharacterized protein n=1 Tax=Flavobacterium limnosediminis JC2902 TaxID=1341181 RepID=V6SU32_9FLAO|nr:hypothetical protein [Flavobacterium limnosediminis]ESU29979.1 hypothetical protein FLJC2902T_04640 [Flavobacterium limnosediminis JC2902]